MGRTKKIKNNNHKTKIPASKNHLIRQYLLGYAVLQTKKSKTNDKSSSGTIRIKKKYGVIFEKQQAKREANLRTSLTDDILIGINWLHSHQYVLISLPVLLIKQIFRGLRFVFTQLNQSFQVIPKSSDWLETRQRLLKKKIKSWGPIKLGSTKLDPSKATKSSKYHLQLRSSLLGLDKKHKAKRVKTKPVEEKGLKDLFSSFYFTFRDYPLQAVITILMFAAIFHGTYWLHEVIFKDLPEPKELTSNEPPVTTKILSRDGEVLFRLYKEENRTIVPLAEINPYVIHATIAIEDQDFYSHHGFSLRGIFRAMIANYKGESIQGGSTLTQQLVKNRLLSPEKTVERKLREALLAVLVENDYSKEEILEMYLNQVPYGGATYGIEEAAFRYFDKSADELTLAESALLAGLPAAPSVYSPFGSNPELAKARQLEVLRRMAEDGYISQQQAEEAGLQELQFANNVIDIQAPHFVMYVKKLLADKYGEEMLYHGGLEITTTLDLELQQQSQQTVTNEIDQLTNLRIQNGAAIVTNPNTGEILAMVGSRDYFDFANDGQVNVTLRPRQPGSSIKPITYATALERGMTVSSIIMDSPVTYNIAGSPPYSPKNYDGKFHGNVTLKEALASSYNVPAVKTLNKIGVNTMIDKAQAMGITTWNDRSRFGLSLTLGGGEVRMIDMAKVYGTFANAGYTTDINPILEIKNYKGEVLYHNSCALDGIGCFRTKTLDSKAAYLVSNILSDNEARTPAFGPQSTLYIPGQEVAVKTGTTNNLRDNWTIGYTSDRVVAVWVGNNDNTPMSYVASGITGASPIWNKIMRSMLSEEQPHQFAVPRGVVTVATCATTGTLPCGGCPKIKEEPFVLGTQPTAKCNLAAKPAGKDEETTDNP